MRARRARRRAVARRPSRADLPGPIRDTFVEEDRALRAEIIDTIEDNFYKPVDETKLDDASLKGMVESLDDPYSHYFTPEGGDAVRRGRERAVRGRRHERGAGQARPARCCACSTARPPGRAGIQPGDLILAVNGRSIAGVNSEVSTNRIKGPAGTSVTLRVFTPGEAADRDRARSSASASRSASRAARLVEQQRPQDRRRASCWRSATAPTRRSRREVDKLPAKQGAEGIVLDLRGNGGGLLLEGVLVSSIFIEDGKIVSVRGRHRAERVHRTPRATRSPKDIPVVVLVDGGSASASEIVTGALRDRDRATVVGTHTFGKGLVQEVEHLSNGGVLDLTVGQLLPARAARRSPRKGIKPQVRAKDDPRHQARRGAPGRARHGRCASSMSAAVSGRRPARRLDEPIVAVLEKRGRFLVAEPLFGPGRGTAVERGGAGAGDLVLVGSRQARRARAAPARAARPRARRGRGPDARPRPAPHATRARRPPRREAAAERALRGGRARGPARPAHLHDRPRRRAGTSTTRSRPAARTAACALWVHIADVTAYVRPGGRARARGAPARHERLRAGRGRADAARGALERGLLAAAGRGQARGDGRDGDGRRRRARAWRSTARACAATRGSPTARWTRSSPGRARAEEPWARAARALAREVARALHARRDSLEIGSLEPTFEFDSDGHVTGVRYEEQTESHRLIEELMILANEQVAGLPGRPAAARRSTACTSGPSRSRSTFLVEQLASLDIPTPPLPKQHDAAAGGRRGRPRSSRIVARESHGQARVSACSCCAR